MAFLCVLCAHPFATLAVKKALTAKVAKKTPEVAKIHLHTPFFDPLSTIYLHFLTRPTFPSVSLKVSTVSCVSVSMTVSVIV
jgi:hypothetical protein